MCVCVSGSKDGRVESLRRGEWGSVEKERESGPKQQTLADSGSTVDLNQGLMGFLSARLLNATVLRPLASAERGHRHITAVAHL